MAILLYSTTSCIATIAKGDEIVYDRTIKTALSDSICASNFDWMQIALSFMIEDAMNTDKLYDANWIRKWPWELFIIHFRAKNTSLDIDCARLSPIANNGIYIWNFTRFLIPLFRILNRKSTYWMTWLLSLRISNSHTTLA